MRFYENILLSDVKKIMCSEQHLTTGCGVRNMDSAKPSILVVRYVLITGEKISTQKFTDRGAFIYGLLIRLTGVYCLVARSVHISLFYTLLPGSIGS